MCQPFPIQALLFQDDHLLLLHIVCVCSAHLLKLNINMCKRKSYSSRLLFLEKSHLTINISGEMSLFMKLMIYLNMISKTEYPKVHIILTEVKVKHRLQYANKTDV